MDAGLELMLLEKPSPGTATSFDAWFHIQLITASGDYNRV